MKGQLWGIHARPTALTRVLAGALPFAALLAVYFWFSQARLSENPADKLLPSLTQMSDAMIRMAFEPDKRSGEYLLWVDTWSSLRRLMIGMGTAAFLGLFVGLNMGVFPGLRVLGAPMLTFISIIPPLALLPILFISFGVDELGKIVLIFLGTAPAITRAMLLATEQLPTEQISKALTLGATQLQVLYRVLLPQIIPALLENVRLVLGAGWLFLIAAEAIASTDGLGYRIFLVRRYLAMDVIIPYALWITLLGFSIDLLLRTVLRWKYPWYSRESGR